MLEARSVAVIGASEREGTAGHQTLLELRKGGFDGLVYPVNPKYEELEGNRCYPAIGEVPGPVDLAVISLANSLLEDTLSAHHSAPDTELGAILEADARARSYAEDWVRAKV